ncbi:C1 family peptidase [Persicitalea jodogahamensis]|nr:C1 family peptidase [Persicitalea jodogahamensis]
MKNALLFVLLVALFPRPTAGQGLIFDSAEFSKLPKARPKTGVKDLGTAPMRMDLTPYVPTLVRQGERDYTCVAIATAVHAIATQRAAAANDTDSRTILMKYALSPMYVFNKIGGDCGNGVTLAAVATFLRDEGSVAFSTYDATRCTDSQIPGSLKGTTNLIRIKAAETFFNRDSLKGPNRVVEDVKDHLAQKRPVVVGLPILETFKRITSANPYYAPNRRTKGGHAATVISYDDVQEEFKLANSYGEDWGQDGFFFMKYADFAASVEQALYMVLAPEPEADGKPVLTRLGGTFAFKNVEIENRAVNEYDQKPRHVGDGLYFLDKKDWKLRQRFRLQAENTQQSEHICVFSISLNNQIDIYFPEDIKYQPLNAKGQNQAPRIFGAGVSDLVLPSGRIVVPMDPESTLIIKETGTDYLCILYGNEPIKPELQQILERVQASSGPIMQRIKNALGSRAIAGQVAYAPDHMEAQVTPRQGDILPIVLEVKSR